MTKKTETINLNHEIILDVDLESIIEQSIQMQIDNYFAENNLHDLELINMSIDKNHTFPFKDKSTLYLHIRLKEKRNIPIDKIIESEIEKNQISIENLEILKKNIEKYNEKLKKRS